MAQTMLEHALSYAKKGWHVIPCYPMRGAICACNRPSCVSPGKHPANQRGLTEATVDEAQIRAWWADMPDASIGVVMEPSNLIALDLDGYHGDLEKLAVLEQTLGALPPTVTQVSGSKEGFHTIFESPGFQVRGVIGGIVVRSKAYIIVAPSNHKSGNNYEWHEGLSPDLIAVAALPDPWKEALRKTAEVGQVGIPAEEPAWLAKIPQGQRIACMRAHFAKETGEVKGSSMAGTTFNVVRSAIRAYAVRDPEAALEAAMEFDAKCVPPWGARMARHVWSAYQRANSPEWGSGLVNNDGPPQDEIKIMAALESAKGYRGSEANKIATKNAVKSLLTNDFNQVFRDRASIVEMLLKTCPTGTTDEQIVGLMARSLIDTDEAYRLIWETRARMLVTERGVSLFDNLPINAAPSAEISPVIAAASEPGNEWKAPILAQLKLDTEGEGVKDTPNNIKVILEQDPIFAHNIRYNVLSKTVEITAEPFLSTSPNSLSTEVVNYLDKEWQLVTSQNKVEAQLLLRARKNWYNPIADYLTRLVWDGVPRLGTWLHVYCGAEDNEFNSRIGTMWLISACARGVDPGVKADCVLILEGRQGAKKSQTLDVLAGDWFSDTPLVIGNKDSYQIAGSRWIVELAELSSMRTSETEAQKAFLSARVDNFRPPYGKVNETFPRFCVFGGTTNDEGYLPDSTGNRRYWPCAITACDVSGLRDVRDQLWAEAFWRYRHADLSPELAHPMAPGERWWFETEEEQKMAAEVVGKRRPENLWVGLIREWAKRGNILGQNNTRRQWTLAEIAKHALDIDVEKMPAKQKALTVAVREAGLTPTPGPENQTMWRAPDAEVVDGVAAESVGQGLPGSN